MHAQDLTLHGIGGTFFYDLPSPPPPCSLSGGWVQRSRCAADKRMAAGDHKARARASSKRERVRVFGPRDRWPAQQHCDWE
jgi:hypothetical protein